jgi:uncharacterized protein (DUF1330 family)
MSVQFSVEPTETKLGAFRDEPEADKSIVMVNLLRFRDDAYYNDSDVNSKPCSGREAYARYSKLVTPLLLEVGGAPLWMGSAITSLIAPPGERWDQVILVLYPSRKAFIKMIETDAYSSAMRHRTAALLDSRLIETRMSRVPTLLLRTVGLGFRLKALLKPRPNSERFKVDRN